MTLGTMNKSYGAEMALLEKLSRLYAYDYCSLKEGERIFADQYEPLKLISDRVNTIFDMLTSNGATTDKAIKFLSKYPTAFGIISPLVIKKEFDEVAR